jgi:hypothetical protein
MIFSGGCHVSRSTWPKHGAEAVSMIDAIMIICAKQIEPILLLERFIMIFFFRTKVIVDKIE